MALKELLLLVFIFNLPFGYARSRTAAFSKRWMLAVHLPVPFIILLRRFYGFGWHAVPLFVLADVAGQLAGGKLGEFIARCSISRENLLRPYGPVSYERL